MRSFQLDHGHAAVALAVHTDAEGGDPLVLAQDIPKCIFQRTGSLSVDQTYGLEPCQRGIVQIFICQRPGLFACFSAQIDLIRKVTYERCFIIGNGVLLFITLDENAFDLLTNRKKYYKMQINLACIDSRSICVSIHK